MANQFSRKRRQRLSIITHGNTVIIRHTNKKMFVPVNWRLRIAELIREKWSRLGEYDRGTIVIPDTTVPDSMVVILERTPPVVSLGSDVCYSYIDKAVEQLDAHFWATEVVIKVLHRSGQTYINTNLIEAAGNALVPRLLDRVPGIMPGHVVAYTTKKKRLGIKTVCGPNSKCVCRDRLEGVWELSWTA